MFIYSSSVVSYLFVGSLAVSKLFYRASPSLPLASPNLRNVLLAEETALPEVSAWLFLLELDDQRPLKICWFHPCLVGSLVS
jgi:hypothetical protein